MSAPRFRAWRFLHPDVDTLTGLPGLRLSPHGGVDMAEDRLELARGQGATDTWIGGPDTVARVLEETGGFGADFTFEATGLVAVMRQAVEAARIESDQAAGRVAADIDPLDAAALVIAASDGLQIQWLLDPDVVDVGRSLSILERLFPGLPEP